MNINTFYTYTREKRLRILRRQGEFVSRIPFFGYTVELFIFEGCYIEVYYNKHIQSLAEIEVLDPCDVKLHHYAVGVNLSDLYKK